MTTTTRNLQVAMSLLDQERPRSKQRKLGPSALGGCRRQAAYQATETPPSDEVLTGMAAMLGTAIHVAALEALARIYGYITEVSLENDVLKGSADAVRPGEVEDAKTTSSRSFQWYLNRGVSRGHLWQGHTYAWLLREGAYGEETAERLGAKQWPVEIVRIRYINRDNGDEWVHEQPYDPRITTEALGWLAEVLELAFDYGSPDIAPRDYDGPGLSVICDGCQWLTRCWGKERPDGRARQSNLVVGDHTISQALVEYAQARALESEGKKAKALARAKLDASGPGIYGGFELSWSGVKTEIENVKPDMDKIRATYAQAGLEIPMRPGKATRTINVVPAREVTESPPNAQPI